MRKWKVLVAGAALAIAATALAATIGTSQPAGALLGANDTVTVLNGPANPVPVGIIGTPTVNVSNLPSTTRVSASTSCSVSQNSGQCNAPGRLAAGSVLNTLGVDCLLQSGAHAVAEYQKSDGEIYAVPLTVIATTFGANHAFGTITNLGVGVTSGDQFSASLDSVAMISGSNLCTFSEAGTSR